MTNLFHCLLTQIINCFWHSIAAQHPCSPGSPWPALQPLMAHTPLPVGKGLQWFFFRQPPGSSARQPPRGDPAANILGHLPCAPRAKPALPLQGAYGGAAEGHLEASRSFRPIHPQCTIPREPALWFPPCWGLPGVSGRGNVRLWRMPGCTSQLWGAGRACLPLSASLPPPGEGQST